MENKIKEIREKERISQEKLAELTGLSNGYICHLERGSRENPTYKTMERIAKALNKEVREVFKIG